MKKGLYEIPTVEVLAKSRNIKKFIDEDKKIKFVCDVTPPNEEMSNNKKGNSMW